MTETTGWAGKLLVVDLTDGAIRTRDTIEYAHDYIGGRGLGAALAWEMLRPGIKPFDPENPLMFLGGPLAGTTAPSSGRTTICALAPQSHPIAWFSRASIGGDMGHHLKYAGYDGIIITGQAPHPVYLWVTDDSVELRDARDLWGQGIMDTQKTLHERLGKDAQVVTIGPAGETLSCISTIGINEGSAAGQGGFGAVMGSKNLKAVAVYGTGRATLAHPEAFRQMGRAIAREHIQSHVRGGRGGPGATSNPYNPKRNLCSRNCISGCGTRFQNVPGTLFPDKVWEGVVQCTSGRFRGAEDHYWNIGFEAGFELNMLSNDWGINHWDLMKGLFPWIGMCHVAGMLPDIGGRPVELNDPRFWYEVLETIATHEGPMAEVIADGGWQAIVRTGLVPEDARQLYTGWGYANHWDGRGPRGNTITYPFWLASALLWMIETRDPMGSTHGYVQDMTRISPFGSGDLSWEQLQGIGERIYGVGVAMDPLSNYEGKAEPALYHARRSMMKDSLPLCDRIFPRLFTTTSEDGLPRVEGPDGQIIEGPDFEYHLYALATGQEIGPEGLTLAAERALTLERAQQIRDFGRTREMDNPVLDFFCDTLEEYTNPLLGERKRAEKEPLMALADRFYTLHGWDVETGVPTQEHLQELGLHHVLSALTEKNEPAI
jgi:aldehyde:ferredoxin oxidoreductase